MLILHQEVQTNSTNSATSTIFLGTIIQSVTATNAGMMRLRHRRQVRRWQQWFFILQFNHIITRGKGNQQEEENNVDEVKHAVVF
jgi:hypothetical protein